MSNITEIDSTIRSLNYVLDCSSQRLKWYIESGEERYLTDCKTYLTVANIYMKEISDEKSPC